MTDREPDKLIDAPKRIWLLDYGTPESTWCDDPSPDGEEHDAVEYVRADTIAIVKWKRIEPIEQAPYITGCKDTHVLVEDERGERYFVPRKWLNDEGQR